MKKVILTEINRYKELMGLNLLVEATGNPVQLAIEKGFERTMFKNIESATSEALEKAIASETGFSTRLKGLGQDLETAISKADQNAIGIAEKNIQNFFYDPNNWKTFISAVERSTPNLLDDIVQQAFKPRPDIWDLLKSVYETEGKDEMLKAYDRIYGQGKKTRLRLAVEKNLENNYGKSRTAAAGGGNPPIPPITNLFDNAGGLMADDLSMKNGIVDWINKNKGGWFRRKIQLRGETPEDVAAQIIAEIRKIAPDAVEQQIVADFQRLTPAERIQRVNSAVNRLKKAANEAGISTEMNFLNNVKNSKPGDAAKILWQIWKWSALVNVLTGVMKLGTAEEGKGLKTARDEAKSLIPNLLLGPIGAGIQVFSLIFPDSSASSEKEQSSGNKPKFKI